MTGESPRPLTPGAWWPLPAGGGLAGPGRPLPGLPSPPGAPRLWNRAFPADTWSTCTSAPSCPPARGPLVGERPGSAACPGAQPSRLASSPPHHSPANEAPCDSCSLPSAVSGWAHSPPRSRLQTRMLSPSFLRPQMPPGTKAAEVLLPGLLPVSQAAPAPARPGPTLPYRVASWPQRLSSDPPLLAPHAAPHAPACPAFLQILGELSSLHLCVHLSLPRAGVLPISLPPSFFYNLKSTRYKVRASCNEQPAIHHI